MTKRDFIRGIRERAAMLKRHNMIDRPFLKIPLDPRGRPKPIFIDTPE